MNDIIKDPFKEYQRESEPGKRERYESWRIAIGLQAVDALAPSDYLLKTAKRHIEGELSIDQVKDLITSYYEENPNNDKDGSKEADLVSARIEEILNEKAFSFSANQLLSIHKPGIFVMHWFAPIITIYKTECMKQRSISNCFYGIFS